MRIYLLKNPDGEILAAHTDRELIRTLFFTAKTNLEIWIMDTSDTTGLVQKTALFLSAESSAFTMV